MFTKEIVYKRKVKEMCYKRNFFFLFKELFYERKHFIKECVYQIHFL